MEKSRAVLCILPILLSLNLWAQGSKNITADSELSFTEVSQQFEVVVGRGVALGDFNGDGLLDVFLVSGENCQVYFGDGKGHFTDSGQRLKAPSHYWGNFEGGPAVGDVNGDGHLDVITGNMVWLNDGRGHFTAHPELIERSEDGDLTAVALADLNHDSALDLFAISNYSAMRVYLNDGHGHFRDSGQRLGDGTIGKGRVALIALAACGASCNFPAAFCMDRR